MGFNSGFKGLIIKSRTNQGLIFEISGFRREVDENCALVGYYAAGSGSFLPTFRDNLSGPSSGFQNPTITQ